MWYPTEKKKVLSAVPLNNSAVNTFQNIFPLDGSGFTKMRLIFSATTSAGAADPFTDGLYKYVKGVTLRTSRGEVIYNNVPGKALYQFNKILNHCHPFHEPILAAAGTFRAVIDLPFIYPFLSRPEDTIFDSGRYGNLELQIVTGAPADFFTTPAANTVAVTLTLEIHSTLSALAADGKSKPNAHLYVSTYEQIHADVRRFWDLESSLDLALFGFLVFNHGVSGIPFVTPAATPGNDHLTDLIFRDSVRTWIDRQDVYSFKETRNKLVPYNDYAAALVTPETELGLYPYLFIQNGSYNECMPTGKKSLIRIEFTNGTATDEADLLVFGMRALR